MSKEELEKTIEELRAAILALSQQNAAQQAQLTMLIQKTASRGATK